ncbi:MAG: SAM-dependent methyltransferase [Acidobacteriota bacterium]|nr:SAM-dependent methyltransferase [Acidobacteriota bacterium]
MINRTQLNQFLARYGYSVAEKALIKGFLERSNVTFQSNRILATYLKDFDPTCYSLEISDTSEVRQLTSCLETLIPQNDQRVNGAYFSPNYIVDFIINQLEPKIDARNLDPSCGSGAFLLGLVDYYKRKFQKSIRQTVKENVFGCDVLPYNVHRAKLVLTIYALQNGENLDEVDFNLWHQDSLRTDWNMQFDNIIGNPPYVKYQDLSDENRVHLLENWQTTKKGTFNLYFAFFELAYKLLKPSGKAAYITPNNYFTSLAGESLREFFQRKKCVSRIIDFSHRKVFDAQTYTAITFFDKTANDTILYDRIDERQTPESFLAGADGSPNPLKELNTKKWRLLKSRERTNVRIIETIGQRLGELFEICVGIATLKDEVFFVDGNQCQGDYYVKNTLAGTFLIEKEITKPVYKISDFKEQQSIANNSRRIICPYVIEGSSYRVLSTEEMKEFFPECFNYLLSEKAKLLSRDKGKIMLGPFFAWGRTQGIGKFGKKILTPTFSRLPRFLLVEDEESYFTNGYGIFVRGNGNSLFDDPLTRLQNVEVVQKILNSSVMHYYITKTSVSIEGGYPCYQKNFIEKFTIPEFAESEIEELKQLEESKQIDSFLEEKYGINVKVG